MIDICTHYFWFGTYLLMSIQIPNAPSSLEDYRSQIRTYIQTYSHDNFTVPFHSMYWLTHWGRVTHICVDKLTIIGSDNGLSPDRRQAIIGTNAGTLLIGPLRTKKQWNHYRNSYIFSQEIAFQNIVWKMAAILSRPPCVKRCLENDTSHIFTLS